MTTTEEVNRVDIRYMRKRGLLHPGYTGTLSWTCGDQQTGSVSFRVEQYRLVLMYRHRSYGDEWESIEEPVMFDRTPCNYGGERLWFLCPHCGKRVAVLCGAGIRFLCRHCYDLPYSSQNETYLDRMMRKSRKIRKRLGASESLEMPIWEKPKGMHLKTFDRLVREEGRANLIVCSVLDEQLEMMRQKLTSLN